jgi:hypothetical protein
METRTPFSNGSEYEDWRSRNCDRCRKDYDERRAMGGEACEIEECLSMGGPHMDGKIPAALCDRAGLTEDHWRHSPKRCPEFMPARQCDSCRHWRQTMDTLPNLGRCEKAESHVDPMTMMDDCCIDHEYPPC